MGMYSILIRPWVRNADIDKASRIALRYFEFIEKIPGGRFVSRLIHNNRPVGLQREVFGLPFYNPVGLGAGLDLHGVLYNDLNNLGFSFVEIGPLDADGVRRAVRKIQDDPQDDILAACIHKDHLTAFTLAYDFCDFFVIDIGEDSGTDILDSLLDTRLAEEDYKPVIVKLPKHITLSEINDLLDYSQMNGIDGIEAVNMDQLRHVISYCEGRLPVIADTGIETPQQAAEALDAGASLIELRNGLVREGPGCVSNILKYLLNQRKNERTHPEEDRTAAEE